MLVQALNLLNVPVFHEASQALAFQSVSASADWSSRLEEAFLRTLSRMPTDAEKRKLER